MGQVGEVTRWAVTFMLVNVLWILFRADSITLAKLFLVKLCCLSGFDIRQELYQCFHLPELEWMGRFPFFEYFMSRVTGFYLWMFILGAFYVVLNCHNSKEAEFKPTVVSSLITVIFMVCSVMSLAGISTFLYFDF